MNPARAETYSRELSHLRFLELFLARSGLYGAAQAMQDRRKAHQERWATEVFRAYRASGARP